MRVSTALARFTPTDPGYTPFGVARLRVDEVSND